MQLILTFIIPIGWVSFYPASGLLGIENGLSVGSMGIFITLAAGIVTMLIAGFVFKLGLRRYESAGN